MYFCLPDFDAFQEKMFSNFMIHEFLLWYNYLSLLFLSVFFHGAFQKLGFLYLIFYEFSILWCCFFLVVDMFFGFSYHDFVGGYFRLFIVVFHGHFIIFFICCFFFCFLFLYSAVYLQLRDNGICVYDIYYICLLRRSTETTIKLKMLGVIKLKPGVIENGFSRKWALHTDGRS